MGITGFTKYLRQKHSYVGKQCQLDQSMKLLIDAKGEAMRIAYGTPVDDDVVTSTAKRLIYKYSKFKKITFVMDGDNVLHKEATQLCRHEHLSKITDTNNKRKREELPLTQTDINRQRAVRCRINNHTARKILAIVVAADPDIFDIVQCAGEADCTIAEMSKKYDVCISDDSDLLIYGVNNIYSARKKMITSHAEVSQITGLSASQLKEFAFLVGCDYSNGIVGIGCVSARKMLIEHGDIDILLSKFTPKQMKTYKIDNIADVKYQCQRIVAIFTLLK